MVDDLDVVPVLLDVVDDLDVVAAEPDVVDEVFEVVEVTVPDELVAIPFLYMLRRFGPPQYSVLFALQTMLHWVTDGLLPGTRADPAWIVLPQ